MPSCRRISVCQVMSQPVTLYLLQALKAKEMYEKVLEENPKNAKIITQVCSIF